MRFGSGVVAFLVVWPLLVGAKGEETVIEVHESIVQGPVQRAVLGNNVIGHNKQYREHGRYRNYGAGVWDPAAGRPVEEYVRLSREAGVSLLRWPGGNHSRRLDWTKTVGVPSDRPDHRFGLPDFMEFCERVNAEPLIVVANQHGGPSDAADLVEYLNAPADNSNPNGGVDWAAARVRDGRKKPWGVKWFVLGNESYHTDVSAEEYGRKYLRFLEAMEAVDPAVRLGAVLEDSSNTVDGWNANLLALIGKEVDFLDFHPYFPSLWKKASKELPKELVARAAMAADADTEYRLAAYRRLIQKYAGSRRVPLVATEHNGLYVQQEPVPYRHTLFNAIRTADALRIYLQPDSGVRGALFWHLSNGYWGMIRGYPQKGQALRLRPTYFVYRLYNQYMFDEIVRLQVSTDHFAFPGGAGIGPRIGSGNSSRKVLERRVLPARRWRLRPFPGGTQTWTGRRVRVDFEGGSDVDYHHASQSIPVEPNTLYRISAEIQVRDLQNGKVGIAVVDGRGWSYTYHQETNVYANGTTGRVGSTTEFRTRADTSSIRVIARRFRGDGKISGTAFFGNVVVERLAHRYGAIPSVEALATRTADGRRVGIVLLNKRLYQPRDVLLRFENHYWIESAEVLSGPSPFATNENEVLVAPGPLEIRASSASGIPVFRATLPPASMAAIRFERQ